MTWGKISDRHATLGFFLKSTHDLPHQHPLQRLSNNIKAIFHYALGLRFGNLKGSKTREKRNRHFSRFFSFFLAFFLYFSHVFSSRFGYQHVVIKKREKNARNVFRLSDRVTLKKSYLSTYIHKMLSVFKSSWLALRSSSLSRSPKIAEQVTYVNMFITAPPGARG